MQKPNINFFVPLSKVDEEQRMVFGYASTEALDSQGDIVRKEAIERALPAYMEFANIREMHQPSAVGVTKEATIDDKGLFIGAKIVDEAAWQKVKEGVYKGFSIGGRKLMQKGKEIMDMQLMEISVVDRPANPEALISLFKAESDGSPSQEDVRSMLYAELMEWAEENGKAVGEFDCTYVIMEVFEDHFIALDYREKTSWKFPYTISKDEVELGTPAQVKLVWEEKADKATDLIKGSWWVQQFFTPTLSLTTPMIQKNDEGQPEVPVTEPPKEEAKVEEPTEKKPDEVTPPVETPVVETPEKKEDAPAEVVPPVETPTEVPPVVETPAPETLTPEESEQLKAAMPLMQKMLGSVALTPTNEPNDLAKVISSEIAKVTDAVTKRLDQLEGQIKTLTKSKPKAPYAVVTKGGETPLDTAAEGETLEKLQAEMDDLKEKRASMDPISYQSKYGSRANEVFVKLRKLKAGDSPLIA